MKVVEFLSYLNSLDIKVWLEEQKLHYQAPKGVMTSEIKQAIGTRKSEILAFLKQAKTPANTVESTIIPVSRDEDLPLSFAQQRLWFLHQLSPDSTAYNLLEALRLEGALNLVALEQSLTELIRRHEILRTTFPMVDGKPVQRIAPPSTVTWQIEDLQGLSTEEQTAQFRQMAIAAALKPFDLAGEPLVQFTLLKLSPYSYILLLKMHHIIYDGWSLSIFFGELSRLYEAFTQGLPSPLAELPIQYADFAVWQRQWLTGEVLDRQLNYWREQLAGLTPILELSTDYPRPPVQTFQGGVECFQLDRDLTQRLKQLSQESDATLFMTLLAAFLVLISRYSGQLDLVVGSPIANRNSKSVEPLMGFFANTLAFRGNLSGNPSFREFHEQVRQTTLSAYAHQDLPFEMLVEKLQLDRDLSRNPLVQVLFSLQNTPQSSSNLSGLIIQNMPLPLDVRARFDLEVNYWEIPEGLEGVWCYNSDLFDATTITRIGEHFQILLQAIVANQEMRISELPLLSEAQRHQLLVEWNDTQVDYPHDLCIHQLFEEQVERNPDAVAVVFEEQQLTYDELNCRANQLAQYLRSLGVSADVLVGICVERSLEMIVGLLGILKAGGAYVPLDPDYPTERLSFMLADTQIKVLLTQQNLVEKLQKHQVKLVCLDTDWHLIAQCSQDNAIATPIADVQATNLAYVIYTSGSTGQPKGVEVVHRGVNRLLFGVSYVHLDETQRFLQIAPISFDASTFEIWGALLHGGKCVLFPESIPTAKSLSEEIHKHGITVLWLTSALFNSIIDDDPQALSGIKQLLIGGEALSLAHVNRAFETLPFTQIINGYGPTESTTFTCCYPIPRKLETTIESIPIGSPIANTQVYILDKYLQPVPIGVPGELHVGGAGLARGYLNRPELTQEKFIPNPFDHSKLYKTGDLARYLPDGNIEYLGRIDHQVKIRGFRIELGEIEAVLSQHEDVQISCVIVREDTPGETCTEGSRSKQLVAYIVPQKDVTLTTSELRQFLGNKLPGYMIPNAFVMLESLPLTPNGKVDRRALKAPAHTSNFDRFIEVRNQLELKLLQIWSNILKIDKIGVQDNFFDLGGHSLLAPYLMTQIQQQIGKDIPVKDLFQNPTIEQLAAIIQKESDDSSPSCLVAIQPNGSNLPFFCVPGAGGRPFYFYHLGRCLGDDQPLYSFENNLYQELGAITHIEDMASIYIEAMQAVQPQGPYFLGGHSYGGNVAFEMAQQLRNQGQEVALLAIVDSSAPTYKDKQMLIDYINWDHARWLVEVSKGIEVYLEKNVDISYDTLQSLTVDEQLKYVLQYFKMANMLPPNAEITQLTNIVQAYKNSCLCLVDYVPKQPYPGKLTILRANEDLPEDPNGYLNAEVSQDLSLGWSEFSSEPVDIHFVLGNHITIMVEPHVQVLAEKLKACIQQAQTNI
ncbi:MAG: amino acid adenylation domain-containing protein [Dolichospermum sp. LBC05a]|nr:amino acid adenylation domain-containing protein [Dolichospermum sp. OL01]MCO5798258.1 amino acid adenylation domain-containing protein [Dolichospermum sp. OL03]MCS6281854.1 amino acid adenylation domain-containing protein [Dolichospermum sp.]QSV59717.1 MAG: amino acid adenylation domain-containing protein [Dolichospermum sp. LBC05a]